MPITGVPIIEEENFKTQIMHIKIIKNSFLMLKKIVQFEISLNFKAAVNKKTHALPCLNNIPNQIIKGHFCKNFLFF